MVPIVLTNTSRWISELIRPIADLPVEPERLDDRLDELARAPGETVFDLLRRGRVLELRIAGEKPEDDGCAQDDRARLLQEHHRALKHRDQDRLQRRHLVGGELQHELCPRTAEQGPLEEPRDASAPSTPSRYSPSIVRAGSEMKPRRVVAGMNAAISRV